MQLEYNQQALAQLCQQYQVAKLYLFGSAATEAFSPQSDIDLIVRFVDQPMAPEDQGQRYWDFLADLEQLLGRSVDLLTEKKFINPYFRQEVEKTKTLIYDRSESQEIPVE